MDPAAAACPIDTDHEQLVVSYDSDRGALWYRLNPSPRPCFNAPLLRELRHLQADLVRANRGARERGDTLPIRYAILASARADVFNLGGDLALFSQLIRRRDRGALLAYATACIDVLHPNAVGFDQSVTTISLVQGDALAGGFEAALSSHVVVAERQARFGLPEVLFNLIPGMGAYSFLSRRLGPAAVDHLILGGEMLTADEMLDLGLVDVVVDEGRGEAAVMDCLTRYERRRNAYTTLRRVRQLVHPITYDELIAVTTIWVDAALRLSPRDLRMIDRLVAAQDRAFGDPPAAEQAMRATG
ncbi:MAG: crotonase/enoyl-CoA hydratase family protein [Candidatus Krumholzibacteriia bacterium]